MPMHGKGQPYLREQYSTVNLEVGCVPSDGHASDKYKSTLVFPPPYVQGAFVNISPWGARIGW